VYRRDPLVEKERRRRGRFNTTFSQGKKFHPDSNVCWLVAWDLVKHMTIPLMPISGLDLELVVKQTPVGAKIRQPNCDKTYL
jgi:hypothetical protein